MGRSPGRFPIPAHNFPNELACVCDSVGKSPACHGSIYFYYFVIMMARVAQFKLKVVDQRISGHISGIKLNGKKTVFLCLSCVPVTEETGPGDGSARLGCHSPVAQSMQ